MHCTGLQAKLQTLISKQPKQADAAAEKEELVRKVLELQNTLDGESGSGLAGLQAGILSSFLLMVSVLARCLVGQQSCRSASTASRSRTSASDKRIRRVCGWVGVQRRILSSVAVNVVSLTEPNFMGETSPGDAVPESHILRTSNLIPLPHILHRNLLPLSHRRSRRTLRT